MKGHPHLKTDRETVDMRQELNRNRSVSAELNRRIKETPAMRNKPSLLNRRGSVYTFSHACGYDFRCP